MTLLDSGLARRCRVSRQVAIAVLASWAVGVGAQPPAEEEQPPRPPQAESEQRASEAPSRVLLGSRSAIRRLDRATLLLLRGTRVYAEPDARSQVVLRLDVDTEVELIERGPQSQSPSGWRLVRLASLRGWIAPAGSLVTSSDFWSEPTPAARKLRAERRRRLRQLLGEPSGLGPFELFSDMTERGSGSEQLAAGLAQVAAGFERSYRQRYRLALPAGHEELSVVLFAEAEGFRHYVAVELGHEDLESAGISPPGLAVLFVGERSFAEVAAVLVHELVHVFNRELFGDRLPQWLEEGLAEDLSYHPIAADGQLRLGELPKVERHLRRRLGRGGRVIVERSQFTPAPLHEMACAIAHWRARTGPDLATLSELTALEFAAVEGRKRRYAESALLVRFLLDGAVETRRDSLLGLLAATAESKVFDAASWLHELAMPSAELAAELDRWARKKVSPQLCRR